MNNFFKKEEKTMKRMLWLFRKVYQNWVVYHKIQMHSFLKVESLGGSPMQKVLEPIQKVRSTKATLRQASIQQEEKAIVGKINGKVLHQ